MFVSENVVLIRVDRFLGGGPASLDSAPGREEVWRYVGVGWEECMGRVKERASHSATLRKR